MRAVCVDGDERDLAHVAALCREQRSIGDVIGFRDAGETLEWFKMNRADLVLLEIELPGMNGLELAGKLRERFPSLAIVFVTTEPRYAMEAYSVHPFGYLLKPLDGAALEKQINDLLRSRFNTDIPHISAFTFGNFELMVDGRAVHFERVKSKELLALLIDRRGGGVSRREAFMEMFEDRDYDVRSQRYFNVIISSLRDSLKSAGIDEIFEMNAGILRIRPELLDCDLYRYIRGDPKAIIEFQGMYMYGYPWAEAAEGLTYLM